MTAEIAGLHIYFFDGFLAGAAFGAVAFGGEGWVSVGGGAAELGSGGLTSDASSPGNVGVGGFDPEDLASDDLDVPS